ncbi:Citrate lyase subunit beta-like protein, mitochondrial [Trametes pubescens]|uniref:Citrate lyase subunit beta-like protein, mitochondrial n=1 Tax=Trametes pubescens TaxID=154538 RepID=A0A1M2VVA7_TRAPU|nr:Citrate lyase subunit beta-like protein, mitochondrial [Trametes pubescens]
MLEKSLTTTTDVIIYDLEDSVPPSAADKTGARERLSTFLSGRVADLPAHERIAVRVNALETPFFAEDIKMAINLNCVRTLVLPKIHSAHDLRRISEVVHQAYMDLRPHLRGPPVQLVASMESAKAVHRLGQIARWRTKLEHGGKLSALLVSRTSVTRARAHQAFPQFAAEDYCADTGVIRTTSRQELLYTRSYIAVTAKAFKLKAIDMVCVNYKDLDYLRDECEDGRRLGFTGKVRPFISLYYNTLHEGFAHLQQAIHPTQVDVIQSTFVPSSKEILRAARILKQMEKAHQTNKGAAGLTLEGGGMEMIDAPMIKQAENVVRAAQAAGLEIPDVE